MSGFRRGKVDADELPSKSGFFAFANLPEIEKRELCIGLLDEFGARRISRSTDEGELIHSCCLPGGGHRNGDRNPSASLNWKQLTYNCYGCGSSGGLLWFIGMCRGIDSDEAALWLTSNTSFGQSTMDLSSLLDMISNIYHQNRDRMQIPKFDESMIDPWTDWDEHHPYLTVHGKIPGTRIYGRGICPQTLEQFRVGYADEYFDGTDRIIIPLFWEGKLVGWQARAMPGYEGSDKYRNSPDFPREHVLYNYDRGRKEVTLVESPMSVLRHFHHRPELTGTLGAKITDRQLQLCQNYERLTLWFDNDAAGWKATRRVGEALARHTRVWVVDSPYAADPADMDDASVTEMLAERQVPYSIWSEPQKLIEWKRS